MRTRLERAVDKRDDLKHYLREWGWARTPSQIRALERQIAKVEARVDRLTPPATDHRPDRGDNRPTGASE